MIVDTKIKSFLTNMCKKGLLFLNNVLYGVLVKKLYTNLYKLPLGLYIDVIIDKDYTLLSKWHFRVPKSILLRCFNELQQDYAKLAQNVKYKTVTARKEEIQFLQYKIFFYSHAVKLMVDFDNTEGCIKFLNENGFTGTREEIAQAVIGELMGLKSNLDDLEALEALEAVDEKHDRKRDVSRSDFARNIASSKYPITYDTSVGDFIDIRNLQREEIARLTKK